MTDEAWARGMRDLVMLPDREMSPQYAADRGEVYRRTLNYLSDGEWLYAVQCAMKHERWFPAPATLISFADEYEPPEAVPLLPSQTPGLLAERRENHKSGYALFRAELARRGHLAADAPDPVASMPKARS